MDTNAFQPIKQEYKTLEQQLQSADVVSDQKKLQTLSMKYNELKETIEAITNYEGLRAAQQEAQDAIDADEDAELVEMAREELETIGAKITAAEKNVQRLLLPKDANDDKNCIIEIRAGAGGDEAALFAADLFRMFTRYAEAQGWKFTILSESQNDVGGFKEVIIEITGHGVYSSFKYESGVHRVQRIPETEKSGRVHTSTATVAVLPEAEEHDLEIHDNDLRIDVFRSGGNGGQSVNTTDSAVRITHIPTGTIVVCQDEKSQHKNKAKALTVLRSRLLAVKEEEERKQLGEQRLSQIGTGDRSEKIRTYNVPQDRITDHRIKHNWSGIDNILEGDMGEIIDALRAADQAKQLEQLNK